MDVDALRRAAGLKPLTLAVETEPKKERGHGRSSKPVLHDVGGNPELRGVPLVGAGPGVIAGTRPGDSASALEQAGRDIIHANIALAKAKAEQLRQVRADLKRNGKTATRTDVPMQDAPS